MTEVDPNTLGETAKALLWVIGLLVTGGGGYFLGNKRKVQLEPNRVEVAPDALTQLRQDCEDEHKDLHETLQRHIKENERAHENLFARVSAAEQRVSNLEGQMTHINIALTRIEGKVDDLPTRLRQ